MSIIDALRNVPTPAMLWMKPLFRSERTVPMFRPGTSVESSATVSKWAGDMAYADRNGVHDAGGCFTFLRNGMVRDLRNRRIAGFR